MTAQAADRSQDRFARQPSPLQRFLRRRHAGVPIRPVPILDDGAAFKRQAG